MAYISGFLPLNSGDSSVVDSGTLTSASNLPSTATLEGNDTAGVVYNSIKGIQFNNLAALKFTGISLLEGHMSFEVETAFLSRDLYTPAVNEHLMYNIGGTAFGIYRHTSSAIRLATSSFPCDVSSANKSGFTRIDISWQGDQCDLYVNKFLLQRCQRNGIHTDIYLGGTGGASVQSTGIHYIRSFHIANRPIMLPVHPDLSKVNIYGHSFPTQGQYASNSSLITDIQEDGLSGADYDGSGAYDESGLLPTIHKAINKSGYTVGGNRIHAWTRSGMFLDDTEANDLNTRMALSLNKAFGNPTCAILYVATNDVNNGVVIDATWEGYLQAEIDNLTAVGCNHIIICGMTTMNNDPTVDNPTKRADTLLANVALKKVSDANTECIFVELFYSMGGADNYDPNDFQSSNLHPSAKGFEKLGEMIGDVVIKKIGI